MRRGEGEESGVENDSVGVKEMEEMGGWMMKARQCGERVGVEVEVEVEVEEFFFRWAQQLEGLGTRLLFRFKMAVRQGSVY